MPSPWRTLQEALMEYDTVGKVLSERPFSYGVVQSSIGSVLPVERAGIRQKLKSTKLSIFDRSFKLYSCIDTRAPDDIVKDSQNSKMLVLVYVVHHNLLHIRLVHLFFTHIYTIVC